MNNMTDNVYYVYQYITEDGIPYYVGKGKKKYAQPKTKEHAEKIRQANLGVVKSDETKKKISETKKGAIPWNKGIKGIPWSDARRMAQLNKASKEI